MDIHWEVEAENISIKLGIIVKMVSDSCHTFQVVMAKIQHGEHG